MNAALAYQLWIWLRNLAWGQDLGRIRRHLTMGILAIALLGGTAIWAQPKWTKWLYPPQPAKTGKCSQISIELSGTVPSEDIVKAKKWIGNPNAKVVVSGFVWNGEKHRSEFWLFTPEEIYMIELVCFEIVIPGEAYIPQFGEFEKLSKEDAIKWDQEIRDAEIGA